MKKQIGLTEFIEKHMAVKNNDGSFSKPSHQMIEMAKVIETAQNDGFSLKIIKTRKGSKIVFVKHQKALEWQQKNSPGTNCE